MYKAWLALPALAAGILAAIAPAQDFEWTGTVASGRTVEVRNIKGAISAKLAPGSEVRVEARKSGEQQDRVRVEVVPHAGGLLVCAVYLSATGEVLNPCTPGESKSNVKDPKADVGIVVLIPAGVHADLRSVNGAVDAAGLRGDVKARSVNGAVAVSTSGRAEASTVNGPLEVRMGVAPTSEAVFQTVNGSVLVAVPGALNAQVEIATVNGRIETDFPLQVSGRFSSRSLSGIAGSGGPKLKLKTVNGNIRLKKAG
jgi:hypothetical protein